MIYSRPKIAFMTRKHLYSAILSFVFAASIAATPTFAFTQPTFGSCINPPQNTYNFQNPGTHYIAGTTDSYQGVDTVYALDENSKDTLSSSLVMQCLCPDNGQGIQTNWWKAKDLSELEI